MVTEVILPVLGETVNECTIAEWYKVEGERVQRGEALFSVESDKAVLDVETTVNGFLRKILVPAGVKAPVLTVVALITQTIDEPLGSKPTVGSLPGPPGTVPEAASADSKAVQAQGDGGRLLASPRARRLARETGIDLMTVPGTGGRIVERDVLASLAASPSALPARRGSRVTPLAAREAETLGVDLDTVSGSGIGGRIMRADVDAAAKRNAPAAVLPEAPDSAAERVPVGGIRRIVADRMANSHHDAARVTLVTEVDATALVGARDQLKAAVEVEWGFAPGFSDLLAMCVARVLPEFPYMNSQLSADGQFIELKSFVNLGMAVDTERGLVVPVIRHADRKGLRDLGREFRMLVERARAGKALPDDITGGTFTITNLGMYEVDAFTPIINLPEAAILGAGRIQPQPVVRDGRIVVRQMWVLSLSFDHRLVDGAPAARFLQRIKRLLETPYLLLA